MLVAAGVAAAARAIPAGPPGDAFYLPPDPLPQLSNGAVVWSRPFAGPAALPSAARNVLVLYETTANGNLTAVSGTLSIPHGTPPPRGWPIISWAHGTVGDGPQCAPSRMDALDGEQRLLDGFVQRGYAVAQTDYEGNGTPGIHPYFVPLASARDVADMVRAAREIDPDIGSKWIVMGHSEGGTAALATAAIARQWAPELDLAGAVAYAPAANLGDILKGELSNPTPNGGLIFLALMLEGFSTSDSRIVPEQMLEPQAARALPQLLSLCYEDLADRSDWMHLVPSTVFRPQAEDAVRSFFEDLNAGDPMNFRITIPTLLVQGDSDPLVDPASTLALRDRLRRHGTPVTLDSYNGATHGSVLRVSTGDVAAWVAQRFAQYAAP